MATLALGFALAWSLVSAYVVWLGLRQRQLNNQLQQLQQQQLIATRPSRAA